MRGRSSLLFRRSLWTGLFLCLVCFAASEPPAPAASTEQAPTPPLATLATCQGKLIVSAGAGLHLATSSGEILVMSDNPQVLHTLQDARLAGRELKLEGERASNGEFKATHILTVRDGKLCRLRYYCHVCNIPATEPGPCVCCQRPTELEEIPVDQVTKDMVLVP